MPHFSAFTPCGMLEFASEAPLAQRIYEDLMRSWGTSNFDQSFDGPHSATQYAHAMEIAAAQLTQKRGGNNTYPLKAYEMLEDLELDYGVAPGANSTLWERRHALAATRMLARGAAEESVVASLKALLGDDFVAYRPTAADHFVTAPADPTNPNSNNGSWANCDDPIKLWSITEPICGVINLGWMAPVTVHVTKISGSDILLAKGDAVVIEPGRIGRQEGTPIYDVTYKVVNGITVIDNITIQCRRSHDAGSLLRVGYFPYWVTNKRHNLIVVSAAARANPEKMRQIDVLMHKLLRGVSTWTVVTETSAGSKVIGPFKVGHTPPGTTTIGAISL